MPSSTTPKVAHQPMIRIHSANFRYAVEIETVKSRDCEQRGCSGMCRCSRIERAWITCTSGVSPSCLKFIFMPSDTQKAQPYHPSRFEMYCIQRLMVSHGCYNAEAYDIETGGGWYGQEVSEVTFQHLPALDDDITKMLAMPTDHAKLMCVLNVEYGFISEIVKRTNYAELVEVELGNIQPSAGAFMLKRQSHYLHHLEQDSVVGVILDGKLLVDGNHRYSYLLGHHDATYNATYINLFCSLDVEAIDQQLALEAK